MATALFCYKGLTFDPPVRHQSAFGEAAFMMNLEDELRERGEAWFFDGKSRVLDEYRATHSAAKE